MQATTHSFDQQRKTLVVGLGKTGLSCARYLSAQGTELAVIDSRDNPPGKDAMLTELPDVAMYLGGFRDDVFAAAEQLLVSPGISLREPHVADAMQRGIPVMGDVEVFAGKVQAPVIAITGSNGKSTVTTLVAEMARASGYQVAVGGNLGTPALDLLASQQDAQLFVLELSSFQLETTSSLNAVAAVILNISEDHMDRYTDINEYAAAKQRIYQGDGVMIINADDPRVAAMIEPGRRLVRFTLGEPAAGDFGLRDVQGETWLCHGRQPWLAATELRLPGRHNQANALAALALGQAAGLEQSATSLPVGSRAQRC
jgi:UDP-N-acetylmuramoylalanine--D-glutamate ligase